MKLKTLHAVAALVAVPGIFLVLGFAPRRVMRTASAESIHPGLSGSLSGIDSHGKPIGDCPLKHTDVQAEISGFIARVRVTQEFQNNFSDKIEAVYTFPLPQDSAVDDMTMLIGDRKIAGLIKRREEARQIYENARAQGHTAGLLDQERPNIFTQSVTNIPPGQTVKIQISYVEMLPYDAGTYSFVFPMVVAPRYIPASVTDHSQITPPVTPEGVRAGHDISLSVKLDAGVPLDSLECATHPVNLVRSSVSHADISLKNQNDIPNRDFVLKYNVLGGKIQDAVLAHHDQRGGFFTLMLTPPERPASGEITPKEIVFVVDTSGSMHGFPLDKSKEVMDMALAGLHPRDTFNLITFSGEDRILFPKPVPATPENRERAKQFLSGHDGSGGTEMMKAIRAALDQSDAQDHIRIACFFTDGEVGNDMEIIGEVKKHVNARVFAFGIGSSVNRFLLDNMAKYGRGEVEYVGLQDDGTKAAKKFYERVRTPLLTDIQIDWNGLAVDEVFPARIQDLFAAKPLVVTGRYNKPGAATIKLSGKQNGKPYVRQIAVNLPAQAPEHDVMATLWARTKVADLMSQDFQGMQHSQPQGDLKEKITQLGLDYRLMTQFTSFVAVEEKRVIEGGQPRILRVPVEMPDGMSYQGVFGGGQAAAEQQVGSPAPTSFISGGLMARKSMAMPNQAMNRPQSPAPPPPIPVMVAKEARERRPGDADALSMRDEKDSSNKLHPAVASLIHDFANGSPTSGVAFVTNGKAELQLWVADDSPAALASLRSLGVEILKPTGVKNQVLCRVSISKLAALAALENVRYIAPVQ